jgi:hypothetical protein
MPRPSSDMATALVAALGAGYTLGGNVFYGPVRPQDSATGVPHKAVFCVPAGGDSVVRMMRTTDIRTAAMEIRLRGEPNNFEDAETFAREVWDATQNMTISGYFSVLASSSEPLQLGQDDQEHFEFMVPVEMRYVDA